jgi:acyl carrier protein
MSHNSISREEFLRFLSDSGLHISKDSSNYTGFIDGYLELEWTEVDVDSLAFMQIAINLEDHFDLKVGPEDLVAIKSVEALFEKVTSHSAQ